MSSLRPPAAKRDSPLQSPWVRRLKAFGSKSAADVEEVVKTTVPEGLAYAYNLGHVDVFPATSGKENAATYLMERFDASPASCFLLCDDDNDLGALSRRKTRSQNTLSLAQKRP